MFNEKTQSLVDAITNGNYCFPEQFWSKISQVSPAGTGSLERGWVKVDKGKGDSGTRDRYLNGLGGRGGREQGRSQEGARRMQGNKGS
jgi:hypothetical protein